MNMKLLVFVLLAIGYVSAADAFCGSTLTTSATMTGNCVVASGDGIQITAAHVKLNCAGYTIRGGGTGNGIKVNAANATIENCNIGDFAWGTYLQSAATGVMNNTITRGSEYGIYAESSTTNWNITNTTANASASGGKGIVLYSGAGLSTFNNFTAISIDSYGIWLYASSGSIFNNSIAVSNSGTGVYYESGSSSQASFINSTVMSNTGIGFNLNQGASGTLFYNSTALSNSTNAFQSTSTGGVQNISNSFMRSTGGYALFIQSSTNSNYLNNTLNSTGEVIGITGSSNGNNFLWNNITGLVWVDSNGTANTFNDSLTGNTYYIPPATGAWTVFDVYDLDSNKYADGGAAQPFNATTVYGNFSGTEKPADWHPYTLNTGAPTNDKYYYLFNYTTPIYGHITSRNWANVTYNGTIQSVNATMTFNDTNFTVVKNEINSTYTLFYADIIASDVLVPTNLSVNWTFTFTNLTGTFTNWTNYTVIVNPVDIGICNATNNNVLFNFTFYDQANPTVLTNGTMQATFSLVRSDGTSLNFSMNWTTPITNMSVCKNLSANDNYTIYSTQAYTGASGYRNLYYYIVGQNITNSSSYNISLYLLNSTGSVATQYYVFEGSNVPVEGAYVQIQRYYPDTNTLRVVSMTKADSTGTGTSYAIANDVNYRYVVINSEGQIIYTSNTAVLSCNPSNTLCTQTIRVSSAGTNEYTGYIGNTAVGCAVDNASLLVSCTSNNPSGTGSNLNLKLYLINTYNETLLCDNTLASESGTVSCSLPNLTAHYYYIATVQLPLSTYIIGNGYIGANDSALTVSQEGGLLATVFLVFAMATVGIAFGFSGVIVGGLFGLAISVLVGFVALNITALIAIFTVGLILAWLLRS